MRRHGGVGLGDDAVGVGAGDGLDDGAHGLYGLAACLRDLPPSAPLGMRPIRLKLSRDCCMQHASAIGIVGAGQKQANPPHVRQHRSKARQKHDRRKGLWRP